jgi:hypothetical protein
MAKEKVELESEVILFILVIGLVAVGFLVWDFVSSPSTKTPKPRPVASQVKDDRVEKFVAYDVAIDMIRDNALVAPSTAKFQKFDYGLVRIVDDCTWIINAYVDSQNSFGAMVRTHYRAKIMLVKRPGQAEYWKMLDFQTY